MMVGRKISLILLIFFISFTTLNAKKILVIPANINYTNEDLEDISRMTYDYISTAVINLNNENTDESKKIYLKEAVLPIQKYSKKINNFHIKRKNINFLNKVKSKYNVDNIVWYYFHKSILTHNSKQPISKKIKMKLCIYRDSIKCYKLKLDFDNTIFSLKDSSIKYLVDHTKAIINDK